MELGMKYAKFDVQYLRDGTWCLNKRFDNIEDAEKRYEDGAKNWLHWEGRMPTTAVRIRRVTVQETYETIRQTEPPAPAEVPARSSWEDLLKASRELQAAEEHLVKLHRRQRIVPRPGSVTETGDYAFLDVAIRDQQNLVDALNLRVLANARKLGRDIPEPEKLPAFRMGPPVTVTLRAEDGGQGGGLRRFWVDGPGDNRTMFEVPDAAVVTSTEVPREPRVNDRVENKFSRAKGTVVKGGLLLGVKFDGGQMPSYGLDPRNYRVIEHELTERPAPGSKWFPGPPERPVGDFGGEGPEVIQFPGPPASTVSYTESDGSVVKLPGRTEAPGKFEVQVRRAGKWEFWPSPGVWYGNEHTAARHYETLTSHGQHVEGMGVRLLADGVVIRETTKDPEPPAERFKVEIFHDGEWHPDQPGGFVTHAAAVSHYEHTVRRWLGRGAIKGVRLLKDGTVIREKHEH